MRFYEGQLYSLSSAVYPVNREFYCEFLHISGKKTAYIGYGQDRFFEVGAASKMILHFKQENGRFSRKIRNIPFENKDGRMVFDYPAFLSSLGVEYELYEKCDIYKSDDSNYRMVYCKNAEITSGSFSRSDYSVYWLGVTFRQPIFYLNGRKVTYISVSSTHPFTQDAEAFVREHLEEKQDITLEKLSEICSRFNARLDSSDSQIRFSDGTIVYGSRLFSEVK